jgi:hypothetical protein
MERTVEKLRTPAFGPGSPIQTGQSLGDCYFAPLQVVPNSLAQLFVLVTFGNRLSYAKSTQEFLDQILHIVCFIGRGGQSAAGVEGLKAARMGACSEGEHGEKGSALQKSSRHG